MPRKLRKYLYKCINGDFFETEYLSGLPDLCPDGHVLDTDNITILDEFRKETVIISDDDGMTQGFYLGDGHTFDILGPTGSITNFDLVNEHINQQVYSLHILPTSNNVGDLLTVCTKPETLIGALTSQVEANGTILNVNSTVTDNIKIGFCCLLKSGATGATGSPEDVGRVKNIDKTGGTIIVTKGPTGTYDSNSHVYLTVPRLLNIPLVLPVKIEFGETKSGGTYVPAGTIARFHYKNVTGGHKTFNFYVQCTY